MHKQILPVEAFTLVSVAAVVVLAEFTGRSWYLPEANSARFVFNHYMAPLIPMFVVVGASALFTTGKMERRFKSEVFYLVRLLLVIAISIIIHFNLKLWSHLINPSNYDAVYQEIDVYLSGLILFIDYLDFWIPSAPPGIPNPYHTLFVLMFVISFTVHGLKGRRSGEMVVTATVLMMVIGAATYLIAPALGPFVHDLSIYSGAAETQRTMYAFYQDFVSSGGQNFDSTYFSAGLAAMPSLHVANATMFWLCAWREVRWLAYLYIPIVTYIVVQAVVLRWHYLIDLIAGIFIGMVCYRLACWMVLGRAPYIRGDEAISQGLAVEKVGRVIL
jgi:membrane-associated phospholipid phosphatase